MKKSIKKVFLDWLYNFYVYVKIKNIQYEGKILREIKTSLSLAIRQLLDKSIPGYDPNADDFINKLCNELLHIKRITPKDLDYMQIKELKKSVEAEPTVKNILSYNIQLKALKAYVEHSDTLLNSEKKRKQAQKNYIKLIQLAKSMGLLAFDPNKPRHNQLLQTVKKNKANSFAKLLTKNANYDNQLLKDFLNNFNKILSLSIIIIIIGSSTYEFGYFFNLGLRINDLPVGYTDLFFISLSWAPKIIFAVFIIMLLEIYYYRKSVTQGLSYSLLDNEDKWFTHYLLFCFFSLVIFISSSFSIRYYFYLLFVSFLYSSVIKFLFNVPSMIIRTPVFIKYTVTYVPLLACVFFVHGCLQAREDIIPNRANAIQILLQDSSKIKDALILKNFNSG
ncbi:TPA: hypothetical protein JBC25_15840, partial [Legionella pneumophila subsp. pneumophila]|nr:hypothetical protein [Legionella pneumophila subsp. pneumophila]